MMLTDHRHRVNRLLGQLDHARQVVNTETAAKARVEQEVKDLQQAQSITQHIAQAVQQHIHSQIASIVSRCLTAVFDDPYEFQIRFDRKRGKTEATMVFLRDGVELDDPLNEIGGGVVDVAAFSLRVACILMSRPPVRRLLVLDEPWKNIRGKQNKARTRQLLLKLSEEMGFQVIINTDIPEYQLGSVIEVGGQ